MEIERDGLYTYKKTVCIPEQYFLSVEYPMIRYNQPERLLPVLLREQDGEKELWYDITHGKTLKEQVAGKNLAREDCKIFLEDFCQLLEEIDALMLDIGQLLFSPEEIYRMEDGRHRWVYVPQKQERITEIIQNFFVWMLSEINYGDSATVRFVYHAYWAVRNKNISKELIRECLNYEERKNTADKEQTEEDNPFLLEQNEKKSRPEQDEFTCVGGKEDKELFLAEENLTRSEGSFSEMESGKKQRIFAGVFLLLVLAAVVFVWKMGVFSDINIWWENWSYIVPYFAGVLLFGMTVLLFLYRVLIKARVGKIQDGEKEKTGVHKERLLNRSSGGDAFDKADYGKEERIEELRQESFRTEVLNVGQRIEGIVLKKTDTGEEIRVCSFPFYIGHSSGLNHLMLDDKTVSRRHAVIERGEEPGSYVLMDCESTNGTWINDKPAGNFPVELKQGDMVSFAENRYQVIFGRKA